MSSNMGTIYLFFNLYTTWLLICSSHLCLAGDTLKAGQKIIANEYDAILISSGKTFELGFFTTSITGGSLRYLGIWYHIQDRSEQSQKQTVVWVANRDNPIAFNSTGVFQIAEDGNLVVVDTSGNNITYWSTNFSSNSSPRNRTLKLMDSGNLVLLDDRNLKLWQSFENPSDTFLPGMKMDRHLKLTSWKSADDPGNGNFSFKMERSGYNRYIILNRKQIYWESSERNNNQFDDINLEVYKLLTNLSTPILNNTRLFLDSTGVIQWLDLEGDLSGSWKQPKTNCLKYNFCGEFASCNDDDDKKCKCLPGFDHAGKGDSSLQSKVGCIRRTSASCTRNDTRAFLKLTMIKTGKPDLMVAVDREENCTSKCLETCPPCQAYSYVPPLTQRTLNPSTCWIWKQNLTTVKENYTDGDDHRRLFVLVDKSDIEQTPRTCEPCGTNIIPYPLSTGSNCGDLKYFNFSCNNLTSQLSFTTTNNNSYRVTRVLPGSRTFTIYNEGNSLYQYCDEGLNRTGNLKVSSPYSMTSNNLCSDHVEVNWEPPSEEPICDNLGDCHGWKHSTCSKTNRCLCNANYEWNGEHLSCIESNSFYLILGLTLTGVVALACIIIFGYACRRRIAHMFKQDKENIQRNVRGQFYDSERHVKNLIDMEGLEENDNDGIEVPYFDFESILIATDNFSDANKLGKGGFGPVYKGKLGGQEIAVKRLSSVSSQGLQEFKNEVVLIAKLQHRNLVKLRGYCIKGQEKILIYEYLPNKSLDLLIFDPTKCVILDWQMRFDIILGIARGLLYLHQDSRLRVIHRDLKTSNILLDEEMQPKISDFGLARIVGGKEVEASTERIVGTYGYMSPEYALDGYFSTKSDVFSFGVVLLEIISGKRNTGFFRSKEISSLLGYAWRLWREDKLQRMDPPKKMIISFLLLFSETVNQFIRCAQIGLLCVQDEPDDRPHMSNVVTMLDNETTALVTPKQPTFFSRKDLSSTASSSIQIESSIQEGR
ncbi:unnamed protein product [Trifolium pratense]|uniref:Uncharacterized protein n=1 Tax=Trifolium pratense TaxID=57577 RepID=A0ACB0KF52_TRIPR|nr:unnamed protein product [Trifolium pratense]